MNETGEWSDQRDRPSVSSLFPPLTTQGLIIHISKGELRSTFIRITQEIHRRRDHLSQQWSTPRWSINFSNCHPINKTPGGKGTQAASAASEAKAFLLQARDPRVLPLCSPKPVPTSQMRQSKVWEHGPKIGVRHIHFLLASIHCGFKAVRPKRREARGGKKRKKKSEKKKKKTKKVPIIYSLPPEETCCQLWSPEQLGAWVRSARPSL